MIFQLKVSEILPEMQKILDQKSIKYNVENLSQFISNKISGVNQHRNPYKPKPPIKTEIGIETIKVWTKDFMRSYGPNANN